MSPALVPHEQEFLKQQILIKGQNASYKGLTSGLLPHQQRDYSMGRKIKSLNFIHSGCHKMYILLKEKQLNVKEIQPTILLSKYLHHCECKIHITQLFSCSILILMLLSWFSVHILIQNDP